MKRFWNEIGIGPRLTAAFLAVALLTLASGIIGLLAYVALWTAVFWQTIRAIRQNDGWQRGVALGLLGIWTALTVHHLVDKLYVNNIYIQLGALFGLLQLLDDKKLQIFQQKIIVRSGK